MRLDNLELQSIYGGAISAAFVNAVVGAFKTLFEFGRKIGSSLRRSKDKVVCRY